MPSLSLALSLVLALASPSFARIYRRDDVATQNCYHGFAYTWDDGPSQWQEEIVDEFNCVGGKTTFFVHGNNQGSCIYSEANVGRLRYAFEAGHQIASNSWSDVDYGSLSESQIDIEIQRLDEAIVKILGVKPRFFRAPQGQLSPSTIAYIENKHGKIVVTTSADSGDLSPGATAEGNLQFYQTLASQGNWNAQLTRSYANTISGVDGLDLGSAEALIEANFNLLSVAECLDTTPYQYVGQYGMRDASWTCDGDWSLPATSTDCTQTHNAADGENTCTKIGERFGISGTAIYLANPYLNCEDIWPYTPVCIPSVVNPLPTPCAETYTAKGGDSCSRIANNYGITPESLYLANPFVTCNNIWAGTPLCIPGAVASDAGCVETYTAVEKDTCTKIGALYGLTAAAIKSANMFVGCSDIWAGTPICIPPGNTIPLPTADPTTTSITTSSTSISTSTSTSSSSSPTSTSCVVTYTARENDNCQKIAERYGLTPNDIKAANTFVTCGNIWAYTPICIPPSSNPSCLVKFSPTESTTCQGVADHFGLTAAAIQEANPYVTCGDIWAWTPICIPRAGGVTTTPTTSTDASTSTSSSPSSTSSTPNPSPSCVQTYSAEDNETCTTVATKFGLSENAVYDANPFLTCDSIWRYTPLCIPPGGRGCTKTIRSWPGATCATIAEANQATEKNIAFWNSFVNCNDIWTDTEICVSH